MNRIAREQNRVSLALIWITMGLTFILHQTYISNYLDAHGVTKANATTVTRNYLYSRYLCTSICVIPRPIVASILVETKSITRNNPVRMAPGSPS